MDTIMHLIRRIYTCQANGSIFGFLILVSLSCSIQSEIRDKISFKDSISMVQDSIELTIFYLDQIKDADVKNYFFNNEDWLYINNSKIALATVDTVDFLSTVQEVTGLSETDSYKFISLALYLKNNHILGCFKHYYFGVYFFTYRRTQENDYEDLRYILLSDKGILNLKGSELESYQLLDRKGELLLIAPSDAKIK